MPDTIFAKPSWLRRPEPQRQMKSISLATIGVAKEVSYPVWQGNKGKLVHGVFWLQGANEVRQIEALR